MEKLLEIPEEFLCPITQEIMNDPVMAADGHSYEKEAITIWLTSGRNRSPMTNMVLQHKTLTSNIALRNAINTFKEKLPAIQREKQINIDLQMAVQIREEMIQSQMQKKKYEDINFNHYRQESNSFLGFESENPMLVEIKKNFENLFYEINCLKMENSEIKTGIDEIKMLITQSIAEGKLSENMNVLPVNYQSRIKNDDPINIIKPSSYSLYKEMNKDNYKIYSTKCNFNNKNTNNNNSNNNNNDSSSLVNKNNKILHQKESNKSNRKNVPLINSKSNFTKPELIIEKNLEDNNLTSRNVRNKNAFNFIQPDSAKSNIFTKIDYLKSELSSIVTNHNILKNSVLDFNNETVDYNENNYNSNTAKYKKINNLNNLKSKLQERNQNENINNSALKQIFNELKPNRQKDERSCNNTNRTFNTNFYNPNNVNNNISFNNSFIADGNLNAFSNSKMANNNNKNKYQRSSHNYSEEKYH